MKYLLSLIGICAILGLDVFFGRPEKTTSLGSTGDPTGKKGFVVEQLFTSQGCSSCPSADRLLEKEKTKYTQNNHVVLLSYHVDYWNRLGWRDPFSKKEYTNLQYAYGGKSVYTPQAIINGKVGFVGSDAAKLNSTISSSLNASPENEVSLSHVVSEGSKINFDYNLSGRLTGKKLKIILALDNRKTVIKRGENHGKTLSNSNIEVNVKSLSNLNTSGNASVELPENVKSGEKLLLAVFLQKEDLEITGAVKTWLKK